MAIVGQRDKVLISHKSWLLLGLEGMEWLGITIFWKLGYKVDILHYLNSRFWLPIMESIVRTELYWLIDFRLHEGHSTKGKLWQTSIRWYCIYYYFKAHYKAFDALGKYIVIGDSIVSKNHKDITKHHTLENVLIQLRIEAFDKHYSILMTFVTV